MDIQKEVMINMKQPCIMPDTEEGKLLKAIRDDLKNEGFDASNSVYFLMSAAYRSGFMHGKRAERERRKKVSV